MRRRSRRTTGGTGTADQPEWRGERIGVLGGVREAILAVMCGVMPWWFGSADPPAVFVISCLILALAAVTLVDEAVSGRRRGIGLVDCLTSLPLVALGLGAVYGLLQWAELGPELLGTLSPKRLAEWKSWGGGESIVLKADPGVTVPSAGARLAWFNAEVFESVVWVAALWVLGMCVLRLPGRWGPLKRHGLVLSISGTLMALQSMLQILTWDGRVLWLRPKGIVTTSSGPFFVHSELAAYLNLCLGFVLARLVFTRLLRDPQTLGDEFLRNRVPVMGEGALAIYPAGIGILAVLASGSRVGFLSMLLGMMVLGAIALRAKFRLGIAQHDEFATGGGRGNSGWYLILGLLGVVVLGLTMLVDVFSIFGRVESIVSEGGSHAAGIRLAVWKLAAEVWSKAPVWGMGWGSFPWSTQLLIKATGLGFVTHAESDYVQILPEGGLIGAGIVLVGLFGLVRAGFGLARGADRAAQFLVTAGALSGLTAVAWGALTENILRTSGVVIPALVTAAHVVRLSLWKRRERTMESDPGQAAQTARGLPGRAGGLALGAALTAAAWPNLEETRNMSRAWSSMEQSRIQHSVAKFPSWEASGLTDERLEQERAGTQAVEEILPGWGDYHLRRAIAEAETFQRRTLAELKREGLPEVEAMRLSRIMELAVVIRRLPPDAATATIRGLLEDPIVRSHLVPAARSLAEAWRTQPTAALTHLELAILNWLFEKGPSVEDSLRRGIELAGNQLGLLLRAGQIASSLGDESIAVVAFARVLEAEWAGAAESERIRPWLSASAVDRLTEISASAAVQAAELLMAESETQRRQAAGRRALEKLGEVRGPEDAASGLLRARALWLTGEKDKAIEAVRLSMAYSPQARKPRILLVEWLIASGQTGKALEEAKVLAYFWPKDAEVEELISRAADADAAGGSARDLEAPGS